MRHSLVYLAALVGAGTALPQAGWEDWDSWNTDKTTSEEATSTTTSTSTTTLTVTVTTDGPTSQVWGEWLDPDVTAYSSNAVETGATENWNNWNPQSSSTSGGWAQWDASSPSDGSSYSANDAGYSSWVSESTSLHNDGSYVGESSSFTANKEWSGTSSSESASAGKGSLKDWFLDESVFNIPVPVATLAPTVHWSLDKTDPEHLKPADSNQIYLASGSASPNRAHQFGWLYPNFTSNAVVLDHSSLLSYTYTSVSSTLAIKFKNIDAFKLAQSSWEEGIIMVVNDGSCGDKQSCYLQTSKLSFDSSTLSCSCACSGIGFEQAVSHFDFEWGDYSPQGNKKNNGDWSSSKSTWSTKSSTTSSNSGSSTTGPSTTGTITTTSTTTATSSTSTSSTTTTTSTVSAGNYTAGGSNNPDCSVPADTVYGLPTACLGEFFDTDLDDSYGYERVEDTDFGSFATQFNDLFYEDPFPVTADQQKEFEEDLDALNLNNTRKLSKRLLGLLPKIVTNLVAKALPITGVTTPYTKDFAPLTIPLNAPVVKRVHNSPWGQQVMLRSYRSANVGMDIYCVDCGTQGSANIAGRVSVSVLQGIDAISASLTVNLALTLKLGFDIKQVQLSTSFNQSLFSVPLSPLTIPGIITIGPELKVGADVAFSISATGQIIAGAVLSLQNAQASVNVLNLAGSASGWTPKFQPIFDAAGTIGVSADFGLPFGVALGINILDGKYKKQVALINRPAVVFGANTDLVKDTDNCAGISGTIALKNEVYVEYPGLDAPYMLHSPPPRTIAQGCLQIPGLIKRDDLPTLVARQSNTTDNNSSLVDVTATETANDINDTTTYTELPSGDAAYNLTDGYQLADIVDTSGNYQLHTCANGNLLLFGINEFIPDFDCAPLFTMYYDSDVSLYSVIADSLDRIPLYYPDEMSATGVSRIRVADAENIPIGAEEIVLVPYEDDTVGTTQPLYYPLNIKGDTFYPAVCHYTDDQPSKMFIMNDPVLGLTQLLNPDIKYTITGGNVDDCRILPLVQSLGKDDPADNAGFFEVETHPSTLDTTSNSTSTASKRSIVRHLAY